MLRKFICLSQIDTVTFQNKLYLVQISFMITAFRTYIFLISLLLFVCIFQMSAQQDSAGKLLVEPYKFKTYEGKEHEAEFGKLWVKENRTDTSKRLIQLSFVVLKTTSANPAPPIVFLAGGPGAPGIGMGRVPIYFSLFDKLRALGDVILLDQRGLGRSFYATRSYHCRQTPVYSSRY